MSGRTRGCFGPRVPAIRWPDTTSGETSTGATGALQIRGLLIDQAYEATCFDDAPEDGDKDACACIVPQ